MSTTKGTRPIDANNLARKIREYMDDFPNATTRLVTCRVILSMLGDENQTPTLRPITREQVEMVRGEWTTDGVCSRCGFDAMYYKGVPVQVRTNYCPTCGSPMTDKAVDMVMERLEEVQNADTGSV